jgi:hypothetical protein
MASFSRLIPDSGHNAMDSIFNQPPALVRFATDAAQRPRK